MPEMQKMKKLVKDYHRIIEVCAEKYPEHFLGIEYEYINKELVPIGIFKCMKCGRPILHNQFNYARVCGACDTGKNCLTWDIEVPKAVLKQRKRLKELLKKVKK